MLRYSGNFCNLYFLTLIEVGIREKRVRVNREGKLFLNSASKVGWGCISKLKWAIESFWHVWDLGKIRRNIILFVKQNEAYLKDPAAEDGPVSEEVPAWVVVWLPNRSASTWSGDISMMSVTFTDTLLRILWLLLVLGLSCWRSFQSILNRSWISAI